MATAPISFSDYGVEQSDIERRRKYAEALQAQSMQPLETQMAGGWAIPISPTQGLAKALQAYVGKKGQDQAKQQQLELAQKSRDQFGAWAGQMPQAQSTDLNLVKNDDEGNAMPPAMQTTQPTQQQMMAWALQGAGSGNPMAAQMAQPFMAQALKMNDLHSVGQNAKLVNGSGQVIAEGNPQQFRPQLPPQATPLAPGRTREVLQGQEKVTQELQPDGSWKEIGRGPAFPKTVAPIVNVGSGAGKVPMGYRQTANSDLEPIPGGPADAKALAQQQAKATGATDVDIALSSLRDAYDRLEKGGGITNTNNGSLDNMQASASASPVGQAVGKMLGTKNQSARNEIAMTRPALLAALMKATGMSARQMDSNAELKLWLNTATDPQYDVQANRAALDKIEKKYLGAGGAAPTPTSGGAPRSFPNEAAAQAANLPSGTKVIINGVSGTWH